MSVRLFLICVCMFSSAILLSQISSGKIDDFENGMTQGWAEGRNTPSPNAPSNQITDGPDGAGDNYLENISPGISGAGSRLVMSNDTWNGDYNAAGIMGIRIHARNSGNNVIHLRLTFRGSNSTTVSSSNAVVLPVGSGWIQGEFPLSDFEVIQGAGTVSETFASVIEFRILSNTSPSYLGEVIAATLDVDNVEAVAALLSTSDFVEQKIDFKVYPNPVAEELFLNIPSYFSNNKVEIYDVTGKQLMVRKSDSLLDIDVRNLNSGIYFIKLETSKGSSIKRFLKQ